MGMGDPQDSAGPSSSSLLQNHPDRDQALKVKEAPDIRLFVN